MKRRNAERGKALNGLSPSSIVADEFCRLSRSWQRRYVCRKSLSRLSLGKMGFPNRSRQRRQIVNRRSEPREASWSAPALWRFSHGANADSIFSVISASAVAIQSGRGLPHSKNCGDFATQVMGSFLAGIAARVTSPWLPPRVRPSCKALFTQRFAVGRGS